MEPMRRGREPGTPRRAARRIFAAVLALLMAAVFWVAVILIRPARDGEETPAPTPLPAAGPARVLEREADLPSLLGAFPAPVLSLQNGTLTAGSVEDVPWRDGWARVATLVYSMESGARAVLRSVWPAEAGPLLTGADWRPEGMMSTSSGLTFARLGTAGGLILFAQTDSASYAAEGTETPERLAADAVLLFAP
ncbi:MAG: hypothetical protein IKP10_04880 [Clostridia bacterium]|nr:hypothetical protein [Clostridia bacterium]